MSQDILCIVRLSLTGGSCGRGAGPGAGGARAAMAGGLGGRGAGAGGQGFAPDIMGMTAGYIHEKEEEENGTKRNSQLFNPCLPIAYTWKLDIPDG